MVAIGVPKGGAGSDAGAGTPDSSDGNDAQEPQDQSDGGNEDCVSLSALAMPDPDNGDQMAPPQVGDRVTYTVEGTVTRVDGEEAYVKRETINGQPVEPSPDDSGAPGDQDQADQDEREQLGDMAGQMGGMS